MLWAAAALIDACGGDQRAVERANVAKLTHRFVERGLFAPEEAARVRRLVAGEG